VGDDELRVTENIARAAEFIGVAPSRLYCASQVHGSDVVVAEEGADVLGIRRQHADVVVAARGQLACCVRTADCLPILVGDRNSGAVAAIHAGWRGIVAGVIPSGLRALARVARCPVRPVACIGPYIGAEAFEVSEDVAGELGKVAPSVGVVARRPGQKPHVDLGRLAKAALCQAGLEEDDIEELGACTFADSERFFSYRRDGKASGRHLHFICPRSPSE
jgi:polyphenol oxidase